MTAGSRSSAGHALTITRVIDAPRELVFKTWTDPRHLQSWWGPKDFPATEIDMDVRPGGGWRGRLRSTRDGSVLSHRGVFREVSPPERLVFTFAWDEEGERGLETLVTVTLLDAGGKTRMTLHQTPFQSIEERDGHIGGWSSAFDRLDTHLAESSAE